MTVRLALTLLVIAAATARGADEPLIQQRLDRVRAIHGGTGPWAVAGYRIGERAMKDLGQPRHSFALRVVHRCPATVQYACMADGLQAATGTSPGKLNLKVEEAPVSELSTTVEDRKTGRRITYRLKPAFLRSIADVPRDRLDAEGKRVAELDDDAIFEGVEAK